MSACKVAGLLLSLPLEDATALAEWTASTELDARGYPVSRIGGRIVSAQALSTALHREGHTVSPVTLKDHRAHRCGCSR